MKRRDLFKAGAVAGAALVLPAQQMVAAAVGQGLTVNPFTVPLRIPPVLVPSRVTSDTDYYNVSMREADIEIVPGTTTRMRTFNGSVPGPTINAIRGRKVVVRQTNNLTVPTSVHLHGAHVAHDSDGYPTDFVQPGAYRDYTYPNQQLPTTLWYHDHAHHLEAENVFRGLSGTYLIRDLQELQLGLPTGNYDVPLVLRDLHLDDNAQVIYNSNDFGNRNLVLVNGKPQPYFRVAARKYRFRLVNASNDRAFRLALSNGGDIVQIASDGGFLPAKVIGPVEVWPAERAEVIIDFSRYPVGTQIVLQNQYGEADPAVSLLRFEIDRTASDNSRIPTDAELPDLPPLESATVTRDLSLAINPVTFEFLINGLPFDPNRIDFTVQKDVPEIWRVTNVDPFGIPHTLHLHLVQFRVLDRNGVPVGPAEQGWKDTATVLPGTTMRLQAKFTGYTGLYPFHCHLIDHSTASMMGQVNVVN